MADAPTETSADESAEAKALNAIAAQIAALRKEHRKPTPTYSDPSYMMRALGIDPVESRERARAAREAQQARLYKLVVLLAVVSTVTSIASVVVAIVNS